MISVLEVLSTFRGAKEGAKEDIEAAKRIRGKLGVLGGSLGTLYLMKKYNKSFAKKNED